MPATEFVISTLETTLRVHPRAHGTGRGYEDRVEIESGPDGHPRGRQHRLGQGEGGQVTMVEQRVFDTRAE